MVEGPGCTNNGRKVSVLVGHKLLHLHMIQNTQPEVTKNTLLTNPHNHESFIIRQVLTIGKELFIIFAKDQDESTTEQDVALRFHFGMNGSLILTKDTTTTTTTTTNATSNYRYKDENLKTCEMTFVHPNLTNQMTILRTYQTTVSNLIPAKAPRMKYERMKCRDVCSSEFNVETILQDLTNPKSSTLEDNYISDVVLNQNILPGVGNIIKIEGLHDARVHPKRPLKSLTREELYDVIVSCRTYAMTWFRKGRSPPKRVYNQTLCGTCAQNSIAIEKLGSTDRTTFWCKVCQTMDSNLDGNQLSSISDGFKLNVENDSIIDLPSACTTSIDPITVVPSKTLKLRKVCSLHGPNLLVLRRCRKGMNQQRIFFACKMKNCKYFCWADVSFPSCKCGKRVLMRISKTEHSGGKWFFSCAQSHGDKGKRSGTCGYFQWVEQEFLDQTFGHLLTPLL